MDDGGNDDVSSPPRTPPADTTENSAVLLFRGGLPREYTDAGNLDAMETSRSVGTSVNDSNLN